MTAGWPSINLWMMLINFGFTVWDYKQFFGILWGRTIRKTAVLTVLSFIAAAMLIVVLLALVVLVAALFKGT